MASGGAGDGHRRGGGDAAGVLRGPHHIPVAIGLTGHLDHRQAMRGYRLGRLFSAPGLHAVGVQQAIVGVFVVHDQHTAAAAIDREIPHAVMVHADLCRLLCGSVAGIGLESRHVAGDTDRIAPLADHLRLVAFRDDDGVGGADRHGFETELRA